jgi:signal transduction histidine kinase
MGISIRWKLATAYFLLIIFILGLTGLFILHTLEREYLRGREAAYLAHANIIATAGRDALLYPNRNTYYLIRDFGSRVGARVLVLDRQGKVIIDSLGEGWLEGLVLGHEEVLAALAGSGKTGAHVLGSGERVLYAAVPVLQDKVIVGAVMLVAELDDIYAALGAIRRQMFFVSLVSGFLAALLSLWLAGLLTRPIKGLTGAAQQMAQGRLEQRVPVRGKDELGQLAGAFNDMSSKLAEVDRTRRRFLADASHELKSPLSSIKALAQALLDTDEQNPTVYREFLVDIDTEADRLTRIVENMLQLTRLEEELPVTLEIQDIGRLVDNVVTMIQPRAENGGVTLRVDLTPGLWWPVNRDLFTRILINLLDNALRHTPAGGKITLEGSAGKEEMILRVTDTGEGIPPRYLPRIFDRFYRVDQARARSTGGTGLGLSIVRQAVNRHGGRITAASSLGKGTSFEITFPRTVPCRRTSGDDSAHVPSGVNNL